MIEMQTFKTRQDWLAARQGRIGGSDAAAILGLNPYKTDMQMWEEKTGRRTAPDISDLPYVKYGTEAEEPLRELFKLDFPEYKVLYEEGNMWLNDAIPWGGMRRLMVGFWIYQVTGASGSARQRKSCGQVKRNCGRAGSLIIITSSCCIIS